MTAPACKGIRPGLYAITDSALMPGSRLIRDVEAALIGGAVMVQYRDKNSPPSDRLSQARSLQAACRNAGALLIINDDPELALRVGAAGVHLGQGDRPLQEARQLLGDDAIIGITCHGDLALARTADQAGADYLAFGRFFVSGTKPTAPPADPAVLGRARQFGKPVTAIGGITLDNGAQMICAGADLLAVVGGLFGSDDTEQRAREFANLFSRHHPLFHSSSVRES